MPRPVFPVVRLPYDQPDRVTRVLVAVRREFVTAAAASRRRQPSPPTASCRAADTSPGAPMTAPRAQQQPQTGEAAAHPPPQATGMTQTPATTATGATAADDQTVDQVTVGVRECTLTPKVRPDILVTAGGGGGTRDAYHDQQRHPADDDDFCDGGGGGGSPYLLVPPVNITAEISRPPLTPMQQYYTATSS